MAGSTGDGAERICRSDGASESRFVSLGSPVARTANDLATGVDISDGAEQREEEAICNWLVARY